MTSETDVMIGAMNEIDVMNETSENDVMIGIEVTEIDVINEIGVTNEIGIIVTDASVTKVEKDKAAEEHSKGVEAAAEDTASRRPAKVAEEAKEKEAKETEMRGRNRDEGDKKMGVRVASHDEQQAGLATEAATGTW